MLPLEQSWYQKLLVLALVLGVAAGVSALVFMGITGTGTDFFFGDSGTGWWTGNWWWIPLTALGGLTVAVLRKIWKIPQKVTDPITLAHQAWVDPGTVLPLVAISAVSLIAGASLGPFFALTMMGGGIGSWLVTRLGIRDDEAQHEYTLTGMASGMGAAFSAPLFAAVLASELGPTPKRNYLAAFIPALFGATVGFAIFFGVTGTTMLGSYALPAYAFNFGHLLVGALLGVLSAFVLLLLILIRKVVSAVFARIPNPLVAGTIGGAFVGLIAFALPLTATSGSSQLTTVLQIYPTIGFGFLVAILIAKMFAVAFSESSGFLGGIVFPIIFIGGTAGLLVHSLFPALPITLCVGCLLAAVPGAFLSAPVSLILIAAGTIGIGPIAMAPIGIAVVTAHISMSLIRAYVIQEHEPEERIE
jgi:H+/Cl- antiporter ClcA